MLNDARLDGQISLKNSLRLSSYIFDFSELTPVVNSTPKASLQTLLFRTV